ncbi:MULTISPECIES: hypothetical protein [Halobacteriales]|uniref:Uncharacterized protein n=2 Tax=Halobacteriales TaxID=2235 RepID=A0A1I0QZ17_9EURY|nr:hypothetical protein [Natrinema salifodinae]SEW32897.1 hypothetical protein SAMN05216285_4166 [Natrinema salifodinae]
MKISRDGVLPQLEPVGNLGRWQVRLGAAKRLFQRSGILSRMITMWSAMTAAYSTTPLLQDVFGSLMAFLVAGTGALAVYGAFDYVGLMPGEQAFGQTQSQRSERSPLKRDTEAILERLETDAPRTDGGQATVVPECNRCNKAGVPGTHKGERTIRCPDCGEQLFRRIDQ